MQLAKSMMLKKNDGVKIFFFAFFLFVSTLIFAQNNSPYSRYGLGDLSPSTNINTRAMGGISAAYADPLSVNFDNPASYSQFQVRQAQRTKKVEQGRVVLDVGINLDNRTLIEPNTTNKFTSSDLLFSYMQLGLPIRKNWGMSFGLRPLSRISYMINRNERLYDPATGLSIDSAITQYKGNGGAFLPTIGTGFGTNAEKKNSVSVGFNLGYLFGNRQNTTLRSLLSLSNPDSLLYQSSDHTTNSSFGNIFFNGGLQYQLRLNKNTVFRLGFAGSWKQTIKASQDVLRQTFTRGASGEELRIDSVYENDGIPGQIIYPATYKAGFVLQQTKPDLSGWLIGIDLTQTKWNQYRFFGQKDSVQNNWRLNAGGQFNPRPKANYFSNVAYRLGFFTGPDYIKVQNNLPQFGITFGMGLPIPNFNRLAGNQYTQLNIALEYISRGNNNSLLKENLFRVSFGINFTDLWFGKRKYE